MQRLVLVTLLALSSCTYDDDVSPQEAADRAQASAQQSQYGTGQPTPSFDWSLERQLLIDIYRARNEHVITHSVVRSMTGAIEYDCPSLGFGVPNGASLTNPVQTEWRRWSGIAGVALGQAEPNGIFLSPSTDATWVPCSDPSGQFAPVYTEGKLTVFPFPVNVDYETGRVSKAGDASVTISADAPK